jgi:hypothetical protein
MSLQLNRSWLNTERPIPFCKNTLFCEIQKNITTYSASIVERRLKSVNIPKLWCIKDKQVKN